MTELELIAFLSRLMQGINGEGAVVMALIVGVGAGYYLTKFLGQHANKATPNDAAIIDRFNAIDHSMLGLQSNLGGIETRFQRFDERVGSINTTLVKLSSDHAKHDSHVRNLETALTTATNGLAVLSGEVAEIHRMMNTIITSTLVASKPLSQTVVEKTLSEQTE